MTKLECTKGCMFVVNKKASKASSFSFVGDYVVIADDRGVPIDGARINTNEQLYTVLYYEKRHFITLVVKKPTPYAISLVFRSGADYDDVFALLKMVASEVRFSCQNFKISSYANRVAEKLQDGVELAIMDVVDKTTVAVCPECGVEVANGTPYCMECGAEL